MDFSKMLPSGRLATVKETNRAFTLKEGQMVHGQIKKLFPGQMAEVQIGNEKVMAKLEVPLKVGDAYYFRVRAGEPENRLQIITGPTSTVKGSDESLSKLIEAMHLPKTSEMRVLLSFFIKNEIPIQRENLQQAELFLKHTPLAKHSEALATIQKMVNLKLPFIDAVFRTLFEGQSRASLGLTLHSFKEALLKDVSVPQMTKQSIMTTLEQLNRPITEAVGNALLGKLLLKLADTKEQLELRFTIFQLLKKEGMLPVVTSLANVTQILSEAAGKITLIDQGQAGARQPAPLLAERGVRPNLQVVDSMLQKVVDNAVAEPFRPTGELKEQLLPLLGVQNGKMIGEKLEAIVRAARQSDYVVLQQLLQSAETAVTKAVEGTAMKDALKNMLRVLGFNYEAMIGEKDVDFVRLAESLKPQLIALIQDGTTSQIVREHAQAVVAQLNGAVLVSGENGIQHQLVMHLPFEFLSKQMNATLEWNGKLKEDGKIDPEFARILFYLDLHSLQKTVIDMQVQNRIVSLTVFNDHPTLQAIAQPLQQKLREGLADAGYQLSGVYFNRFPTKGKTDVSKVQIVTFRSGGVDYRI